MPVQIVIGQRIVKIRTSLFYYVNLNSARFLAQLHAHVTTLVDQRGYCYAIASFICPDTYVLKVSIAVALELANHTTKTSNHADLRA